MDGGEVVSSLAERTLGRTTAEDVLDPATGKVLLPNNTLIEEPEAEMLETAGVEAVKIRSVLTCESRYRRLRPLLWPRPRTRHAGEYR